jgi:hypothetical protein
LSPTGDLSDLLAAELGAAFEDLRGELPANPHGPNGPFGALPASNVQAIVVHHSAGPASVTWPAVASFHVNTRGFAGIGYHLGIRQGRLSYLGDVGTARAHVANLNHLYVGVCVAGNYQSETPSAADLALLRRLVPVLDRHFGRALPWRGHRDVAPAGYTVCPGQHLEPHVLAIRQDNAEPADQLAMALRKWADTAQRIQPNASAALYRQIIAHGYWPISDESGANGTPAVDGCRVVAQLAREWKGTGERVYYWDGAAVRWLDR